MGRKRVLNRVEKALAALLLFCLALSAAPAKAGHEPPVELEVGRSHEMVEGSARYLVGGPDQEISFDEALVAYRNGDFATELEAANNGEFHDWRVWIALPFQSGAPQNTGSMRRVIGLGGIFVRPPRVHLACEGDAPREILASRTHEGGPLSARYFTYVRSQSFTIAPGQQCLALINTASSDNPNIGIFREGELGTRQVVAVLLKGGFTATLLIIGVILAVVSYLTSRPLGVLIGITYSLAMIQNEASLFTTTLVPDPLVARETWESITLLTVFAMLNVFLFGFRRSLRLENWALRVGLAVLAMVPLVAIARSSNSTPDIIWAFYVALLMFAVTVALRFDIARPLRLMAGGILIVSAIGAILIEPYYLGRDLSDLTIEWFRDAFRLFAGLGILGLLLVDVLRTRRERAQMFADRIEALETQAETDRRLLDTEREYARAREAATRTKAQLAAASHDIRQPIVGLRAAVASEAERLSPGLQARLGEAIDYLEHLTREYSDRTSSPQSAEMEEANAPYSVDLITTAVGNMFEGEARQAGITLTVSGCDCRTRVPALALIRATSNLVANALRHAEPDTIELTAEKEGGRCRIRVRDDGRGMDAATLAKVQTAGAKSATSDGDGLGLAIVNDLASRHQFEFDLSSSPGTGTEAAIAFPRSGE
ncbi:MAG: ATP-binding protein [Erythrobacter sp.]|nr:ATP-binding protein [Erythrobacter sp.]